MDVRTEALYKNEPRRLNIKKTSESSGEGEFGHLKHRGDAFARAQHRGDGSGPNSRTKTPRVPVSRENIARMDPTHPLWDLVGERIAELNKKVKAPTQTWGRGEWVYRRWRATLEGHSPVRVYPDGRREKSRWATMTCRSCSQRATTDAGVSQHG